MTPAILAIIGAALGVICVVVSVATRRFPETHAGAALALSVPGSLSLFCLAAAAIWFGA